MGLFKFSPSKKLWQESTIVNFFQNLICNDTIHFMISISLSSTYALLTNMIAKIKIPVQPIAKFCYKQLNVRNFLHYVITRTHQTGHMLAMGQMGHVLDLCMCIRLSSQAYLQHTGAQNGCILSSVFKKCDYHKIFSYETSRSSRIPYGNNNSAP